MGASQQALLVVGGVAVTPTGALVRMTATDTNPSGTLIPIIWDAEEYDVGGWHDNATNNTRLTVPSGVSLVRVTAGAQQAAQGIYGMSKSGAAFRGQGYKRNGTGARQDIVSGVIAVSAGNYFEILSAVDVNTDSRTWASIEKLDAATKYSLLYRSGTLALSAGVSAIVGFDSEVADTDGWHDTVTNNTRLTVPSGVTRVRISGGAEASSNTGQFILSFNKNGANFAGQPQLDQEAGSSTGHLCACSPILEVTAGDYFEMFVQAQAARTLQSTESTWFCIEEVPNYARALVGKSASQAFATGVPEIVDWDSETYDTAGIHDNVTNNTRLTVPSGMTQARIAVNLINASASGIQTFRTLKNGASYSGMLTDSTDTSASDSVHGFGPWLSVVPGDYFEVEFTSGANLSLATSTVQWFAMECR